MKNAIMAVTKSAYATFHAPPWWPPCPSPFFFLMIMIWAFFSATSGRLLHALRGLVNLVEIRSRGRRNLSTRELDADFRADVFGKREQRALRHFHQRALLRHSRFHLGGKRLQKSV